MARLEQLRLERAGYQVIVVASADEGLEKVDEGGIELILLDQRLRGEMSGLEFFRQGQGRRLSRAGDPGDRPP